MRLIALEGLSADVRTTWFAFLALAFSTSLAMAQSAPDVPAPAAASGQGTTSVPLTLTFSDALQRAHANSPEFQAALREMGLAHEDRIQGRAGLLPSVIYNNQFLYTQGNGTLTGRYVANNGVHEYISQGDVHQAISLAIVADYKRAAAAEALAKARAEIAARGLEVVLVQGYYGLVVAQRKYATAQQALAEAGRFRDISQKLEQGGEVAHADVIRAQIQFQQVERDFQEARLGMEKARLSLAVLLFPDFNESFTVVDDLEPPQVLPEFPEVATLAGQKNPELRAAVAALDMAHQEVKGAWSGLLPAASIDYFYGIDANHFATRSFDPVSGRVVDNLGYSVLASMQIPIWNWGANRSKLKQASLRRDQARTQLSYTQRELLSNLRTFYNEAETARSELESLSRSAELASEGLRLTTLRYQSGEATVLEVVDAQNTLTLARNSYADGQARYRLAIATLQTLTGSF
jgi:outer membrane protein TolC